MLKSIFDTKGIFLGFLLIGIFLGYRYFELRPVRNFETATNGIVACTKLDKEKIIGCVRPLVQNLVQTRSGGNIMDALSAKLTSWQCHYVGHMVGQQSYIKYRDIEQSLSQCNQTCDSACSHGVLNESLIEQLGFTGDVSNLQHISAAEVEKMSKKLCITTETCHGVGHALFQVSNDAIEAAHICRAIAKDQSTLYACNNGVYMEYADMLTAVNVKSLVSVRMPTIEDLPTLCSSKSSQEMRSCFRYFPRIAIEVFTTNLGLSRDEAFDKTQSLCALYSRRETRIDCMVGVGAFNAYSVVVNQKSAIHSCTRLPLQGDTAACFFGQVQVATKERIKNLISYCGAVPDLFKDRCYQSLFFSRVTGWGEDANTSQLCDSENTSCKAGYQNRKADTWEILRKSF